MDNLILLGGIVLLVVAYILYQRQRERALVDRLKRAGRDPDAVVGEIDAAIAEEKAREEWWKRQNPRGL